MEGAKRIKDQLSQAEKDFDEKLMMMFLGSYSAGKSTLINSILKSCTCDTGVKPTTECLQFIPWEGGFLVDSAGVDAPNRPEHDETALKAAARSNLAVVVVNGLQPLRNSEGPILRELLASKSDIVVAINYWNVLGTDEKRKESMSVVEEIFAELNTAVKIIGVNAVDVEDLGVIHLKEHLKTKIFHDAKLRKQKEKSGHAAVAQAAKKLRDLLQEVKKNATQDMTSYQKKQQDVQTLTECIEDLSGAFWKPFSGQGISVDLNLSNIQVKNSLLGLAIVGLCAGTAGLLSENDARPRRERLQEQVKETKEKIDDLCSKWKAYQPEKQDVPLDVQSALESIVSSASSDMEKLDAVVEETANGMSV